MNLTLFLPHTLKDTANLLRLLDWIAELGGQKKNRAIVLSDFRVPQPVRERIEKKAKPIFAGVAMAATSMALGDEAYPIGPNWMFETALKEAVKRELPSFLWLEPDCVPMRSSWLQDIEGMFARCGRPYMGQIAPGPNAVPNIGRIAAFAMPAAKNLMRFTAGSKKQLWNTRAGGEISSLAHHTSLIVSNGKSVTGLHQIPKVCALFHSDKTGSIIKMLRETSTPSATTTPETAAPKGKSTGDLLAELAEEGA